MHAAFSVPTLLILMRFSPKKENRNRAPPKFGELYRLVAHDPDVLVRFLREKAAARVEQSLDTARAA